MRRSPVNREPYTTCALPRSTGANSLGQSSRVVLEIGVLHEHEVAGDLFEPGADRGSLALVLLVVDDADRAVGELAEHLPRAVGAAVVDEHELAFQRDVDGAHAPHDLDDGVAFVVDRHDDRQLVVLHLVVRLCHRSPGTSRT